LIELNKFYIGESVQFMKDNIPDNFVDLTVTSPPYDDLRKYNGFIFDYQSMLKELYRVTKDGGVVVWVVGDKTDKGSETLTSFKHALFAKEIGFNVHDTMIWYKTNAMPQVDKSRYTQSFEYMFVYSKGKPKTAIPKKTLTKNGGKFLSRGDGNDQNINKKGGNIVAKERIAFNVYELPVGGTNYGHPAIFPEQLAEDHITSWSKEGDVVFDPMCGSGTTCKMAWLNKRNFIGIDISEEYINDICIPRLKMYGWDENSNIIF
jgi:DNA modification methylase